MNESFSFNKFYDNLIAHTKNNSIIWKPLNSYSTNANLDDLFQCVNGMPDLGLNCIKFSTSYYTENSTVGTLFLIEVYHPSDYFSGLLFLISLDNQANKPVSLSNYYNIKQGDLVALRIVIENSTGLDQVDSEKISYFMDHFFD